MTTINQMEKFCLSEYLKESNLAQYKKNAETWTIQESSSQLAYFTHGFFRFYGKFPPPVASRFIEDYFPKSNESILDPMVGSGTTLVEATIKNLDGIGVDINPLCVLISKAKTTYVDPDKIHVYLDKLVSSIKKKNNSLASYIPHDKYLNHWFFDENITTLARIRKFLEQNNDTNDEIVVLFKVALASIIRNISRASKGMGRMFLDPALEPADVLSRLSNKIEKMTKVMEAWNYEKKIQTVLNSDARNIPLENESAGLVICHPPYYNLYKFSSIFKFEMLWLGLPYKEIKKSEVREGFKLGSITGVQKYVFDMHEIMNEAYRILKRNRYCVLMMGDAVIKNTRVNTTSLLLKNLTKFEVEKIIVRIPKFTEASYSAGQRRKKEQVGVNIPDHLIVLRKK